MSGDGLAATEVRFMDAAGGERALASRPPRFASPNTMAVTVVNPTAVISAGARAAEAAVNHHQNRLLTPTTVTYEMALKRYV